MAQNKKSAKVDKTEGQKTEGQKTEAEALGKHEVKGQQIEGSEIDVEDSRLLKEEPDYPDDLPVLPVRDTVLFPHAVMPLNIGRESSISLINSLGENKYLGVVTQRDPRVDSPEPTDLYEIGALAMIHKVVRMPNNSLLIFCEGLSRIKLTDVITQTPFYRVRYELIVEDEPEVTPQLEALRQNCISVFQDVVRLSPALSDEMGSMVRNIKEPGRVADFIAATLPGLPSAEKQGVLENTDIPQAPRRCLPLPQQGARSSPPAEQDPVAGAGPAFPKPARVLPARTVEGDPEGAGRQGRNRGATSKTCARNRNPPACPKK